MKIKKVFNIVLISMLLGVFLCENLIYALPFQQTTLRLQIGQGDDTLPRVKNTIDIITFEKNFCSAIESNLEVEWLSPEGDMVKVVLIPEIINERLSADFEGGRMLVHVVPSSDEMKKNFDRLKPLQKSPILEIRKAVQYILTGV
jgi:hypothetical protein